MHNNLSDFHLHTQFSSDSKTSPLDVIKRAKSLGLKNICFTDHNDFDYPLEDGKIVFNLDYNQYTDYMFDLKEKMSHSDLSIYVGVEQGLMESVSEKVNAYDKEGRLDFIIGSSHLVNGVDPYYNSFWQNVSVKEAIEKYYESIICNIKSCSNFDVYGHLDYIIRYTPNKDNDYDWNDYREYFEIILKSLIEKGKGIEINTGGLKYGLKNPNPCIEIIKLYKELGGEIITTGSDAHTPEHIAYGYHVITDILTNAGFNYYTIFNKRKPEFIKLQ